MSEKDLELKRLGSFTGTLQYWREWLNTLVTDGVHYIMENGYAWLVTDAISVIKTMQKLRKEPFLVIRLELDKEESTARMIIDDGNDNVLYTQNYGFTDAKRGLKLYFQNNVVLLPSEY